MLPSSTVNTIPDRYSHGYLYGSSSVAGTINGVPFRATLEPDGQKSHWLKVSRNMREAAGTDAGDVVTLEIAPASDRQCLRDARCWEATRLLPRSVWVQ